jgi:O-antigen ligase
MLNRYKPFVSRLAEPLLFAGSLCIAAGLSWSHFLLSLGTGLITASFVFSPGHARSLRIFMGNKVAILCSLLLLVSILSYFNSSEKVLWWRDVRIKLPLLLIPLGFCACGNLSIRRQLYVLAVFLFSVSTISLLSMIHFAMDYERISQALLKAKPIPITGGISHIYFGVLMAFAVFAAWYLYAQKVVFIEKKYRIAVVLFGLIPFLGLHILSSRTGLMVFYISALLAGGRELLRRKKYAWLLIFLVCLLLLPVVTYQVFSSFRNKVANTMEDINTYAEGKNRNFQSISTRLESLETAWEIFREHPVTGVGIGDLAREMDLHYTAHGTYLTPENRIMPHNEFFYYMAAYGIAGTIVLLAALFYPAFSRRYNKHFLFLPFILITISALMIEALLERQIGVTFFIFFLMLLTQKEELLAGS